MCNNFEYFCSDSLERSSEYCANVTLHHYKFKIRALDLSMKLNHNSNNHKVEKQPGRQDNYLHSLQSCVWRSDCLKKSKVK